MPISRAVRRLLRIRDLIEEHHRMALEAAAGGLYRLERALDATRERERAGRMSVATSARSGDGLSRIAGLVDAEAARRQIRLLGTRVAAAELEAGRRRQEFLEKRIERRQAETLVRQAEARDAVEAGRREQQRVDDWFGSRAHARAQVEDEGADSADVSRADRVGL